MGDSILCHKVLHQQRHKLAGVGLCVLVVLPEELGHGFDVEDSVGNFAVLGHGAVVLVDAGPEVDEDALEKIQERSAALLSHVVEEDGHGLVNGHLGLWLLEVGAVYELDVLVELGEGDFVLGAAALEHIAKILEEVHTLFDQGVEGDSLHWGGFSQIRGGNRSLGHFSGRLFWEIVWDIIWEILWEILALALHNDLLGVLLGPSSFVVGSRQTLVGPLNFHPTVFLLDVEEQSRVAQVSFTAAAVVVSPLGVVSGPPLVLLLLVHFLSLLLPVLLFREVVL